MRALATLAREQLGVLGISALLVLAAGFLFQSVGVLPLDHRNRMLDEALARIGGNPANGAAASRQESPAAQIQAFYSFFQRGENLTAWLGRIHEAGRQAGLSLPSADYQSLENGQRLTRYRITLPLTGTYVQIRTFLKRVLNDVPVLSLDHVDFRRAAPGTAQVEAEVTFTLYLPKS